MIIYISIYFSCYPLYFHNYDIVENGTFLPKNNMGINPLLLLTDLQYRGVTKALRRAASDDSYADVLDYGSTYSSDVTVLFCIVLYCVYCTDCTVLSILY